MKLSKFAGATSEIWQIFVRDSSSTTGAGLTGLVNNTSGLTAYYHRDTDTTATAISLVSMTVGTFTSSGFKEIDATHMPGWYQFCPPNAAIASGAKSCGFHLQGVTNMAPLPIEVQLTTVNPDSAAFGLSLAKTTNITGFNDIAATAIVSSGAITTSGGAVSNVTTVGSVTGLTASNLDATVSSRLAGASYTAPPTTAQNATAVLTTQMTESYAALHAVPTLAQILFESRALLAEKSVASTTLTTKKIDGSTTAEVFTLNDATAPTAITRSS